MMLPVTCSYCGKGFQTKDQGAQHFDGIEHPRRCPNVSGEEWELLRALPWDERQAFNARRWRATGCGVVRAAGCNPRDTGPR